MKEWLSISGDFEENDDELIYHGNSGNFQYRQMLGTIGYAKNINSLANGEISVDVNFETVNNGDEVLIIFNYYNDMNFLCAGVSNTQSKYVIKHYNGQWNILAWTGYTDKSIDDTYNIKVRILGSFIELYINNILAISTFIPVTIQNNHVGIYVQNQGNVYFKNFKVISKKPIAFTISQFGSTYDILYDDVIKPTLEKYNYESLRADEIATASYIINDVINSIINADIIIAEISPDNPNVFYELGYAHAINKKTILLCEREKREKLPFDISGFRTIFYEDTIGGKKQVLQKLEEHLNQINRAYKNQ